MKTGEIKNPTPLLIAILPLLSLLAAILPDMLRQTAGINTVKSGVITLLLTGAAVFYIRNSSEGILEKKLAKTMITISYLGSILLLLTVPTPEIFCFWMLGGLLVSMLLDSKLGLLLHFNLSILMGITVVNNLEDVIQVLLIGALMCMLSGALRQKSSVIYASIIVLSTSLTVSFAMNNFLFDGNSGNNYLNSFFSILAVLTVAFFVCMLFKSEENESKTTQQEAPEKQIPPVEPLDSSKRPEDTLEMEADIKSAEERQQAIEESAGMAFVEEDTQLKHGTRTSYELLCDLDNELLGRMKQFSESLYEHSLRIGNLSRRAALEIGANEKLAMAGGLYHDVGKIKEKNYIEEGLLLAQEYAFPKELKAIIKEHNIKYEKPGSIEAAIVMLSDSVVSTIDYIEKNDDRRFTKDKLIDNIFQLRLDKGTFDETLLSLKDYNKLRDFYRKEFCK